MCGLGAFVISFSEMHMLPNPEPSLLTSLLFRGCYTGSRIKEVLQIILEIAINLIGSEEFGVLLLDEKTNRLEPVASEGIETSELPSIAIGHGIIGGAVKTGENYFIESMEGYERDFEKPIVCIPLKIKEHVIGVIAIYKLLTQKDEFTNVDYELFTLLAGHAATAVFSSRMYSDSERKLSTIQGFIDLLTK